jgi:hypothetical protein
MYDLRQLSALNGTLPTQQNPAGVTAQLVDLLAMQKVEEDKKAAARALAIAAGQANMPTVAQGLEQQALNSARGEIAQKLGLAGLAQQQAPQGPAPQQPPAQGIASAPSPLPQTYQGGGIVAFAKAGTVPEAEDLGPPVMDPEALAFEQRNMARIESEQNLDPETLAASREARYDKRLGASNLAAIENQKVRTAGLQALYDRQVAERPSSFITGLQRMGENVHALPGQQFQGVSSAITKAREGYTTQDIANQTAIDGLNIAMEKAIRENDIGAYNAAVAGLDEAKARIAEGGKQGTTVMDVNRRTQTQKETNYETNKTRKQIAKDNAAARAQISSEGIASRALTAEGQADYRAAQLAQQKSEQDSQSRRNAEMDVKAYMARHPQAMFAVGDPAVAAQMDRDEAIYRIEAYKRHGVPINTGPAAPAPTIPKVGEVRGGYTFKGGDPSLPSSWTKN